MARIMVVDDERDVVTLMRFVLEKDGYEILEAYNGADALAKLGVEPRREGVTLPDLMIVDVMMPVMDGFATATRLREEPLTRALPLIILTAKGQMKEMLETCPNVAAYIEKPFDPKNLRELVAGMLAGNR